MRAWLATVSLSLHEMVRPRPLVALAVVLVVLVAGLNALLIGHFAVLPAAHAGSREGVATTLGLAAYIAAVVSQGIVASTLFPVPLATQQATGRIAALLATTVRPRGLWTATAAALWLLTTTAGTLAAGAVLAGLSLAVGRERLAIDGRLVLVAFALVPLLFAGVCAVVCAVGLSASVGAGNAVGVVTFSSLAAATPRIIAQGGVAPFAWTVAGVALAAWLAAVVLAPRLTAARMVQVGT